MTKIKRYADQIKEEICGAKDYAEHYIEEKARGNMQVANRWKEMANDELKHAMYIHDIAVQEIEELRKIYTPPQKMLDKWEEAHNYYVEKAAWVKQMLAM